MAKKEEIILGSGDLYYMEFDGTNIPEDTVLEVEETRRPYQGRCIYRIQAEFL